MSLRAIGAAAVLVLALAGDAAAQTSRARSDALFEPWRASASRSGSFSFDAGSGPRRRSERTASHPAWLGGETEPIDVGPRLADHLQRRVVAYATDEAAGTVIIDTAKTYLYLVLGGGQALRYGVGVGRDGFLWSGRERVTRMAEWPDWRPPREMLERTPGLPDFMPGGLDNPLGARALYLGNTLYRIHGTNEPSTIGQFVSSGCIRMRNQDVMDLYRRVSVGTQVVVLDSPTRQ
jgi:lipoprotein-anchoring transpeptidase ErfK/SrfK